MKKKPAFVFKLVEWFEKNQRLLPWRQKKPLPYRVWIAEIMSQQTQIATLLPYYVRFFEKFPTVEKLAKASESEVLQAWTGLGYYSRARNVQRLAQIIFNERGGHFPTTAMEWEQLPGVGPYTAAAVASQCFEEKVPVWDGNVLRVMSRFFRREDAYALSFKIEMMKVLQEWMENVDSASSFNQAWMELGALICTPKNPSCEKCPLNESCESFLEKKVAFYPPPKPRKKALEIHARVWVLEHHEELFLMQRKTGDWFSGMWDFPSELGGVKMPLRPLSELENLAQEKPIGVAKHNITHHKITLAGQKLIVQNKKRFLGLKEGSGKWISIEALSQNPPVPLSTTARKILKIYFRSKNVD